MLVELSVENVAIIERAQIALGSGLTVLTGETGAGKSLLVDALELGLGERADSELVRAGAAKASVVVTMDLAASPDLVQRCVENGFQVDNGMLRIHREVLAEGRSTCRIGGRPAAVSALRQLGLLLVDLHGQHDHQSLLDPLRHIGFLDEWIGAPAHELLSQIGEAASRLQGIRQRLAALRTGLRDREHRLDLLKFQVEEISAVEPRPGEMAELEAQLARLRNMERLADGTDAALHAMRGAEYNAVDGLRSAVKAIEEVERFDPSLGAILETLRASLVQAEECAHDVAAYLDSLEADPALLEEVAGRIDTLKRLRRKYGEDEEAVLLFLANAQQELALLGDSEASEEELVIEQDAAEEDLRELASRLSSLRKERAIEFAELVQRQLRDLAMERAQFEVSFRDKTPDALGMDEVEFFFSANAGEPPRPLSKIASGGEISRVMLGIKTAMAGRAGVPTLIFDEVDVGLGGKAAATVARKLEELARHYQVIVISHLPQIAAKGQRHYRIEKAERDGRVTTEVRLLSEVERVSEIGRMLAGDTLTESALANARELLGFTAVNLFN